MERLVTVADVKERYGCSRQTARKYLRECNPHMEKPLAAPAWAFQAWEESRLIVNHHPEGFTQKDFDEAVRRLQERVVVPRRR